MSDHDKYFNVTNELSKLIDEFSLREGYTDEGMISVILQTMNSINKGKFPASDRFLHEVKTFFVSNNISNKRLWVKLLGVSLDEYFKVVNYG